MRLPRRPRSSGASDEEVRALAAAPAAAPLAARERAIVDFALKLTRLETRLERDDHEPLRRAGLDDDALRLAVQIVGYFNYVNRHVDGLGVELEPDHPGRIYGDLAMK